MSVMECNRKGCMHIMCRRYSTEFGYICSDCYGELERLLESTQFGSNLAKLTEEFMNSEKGFTFDAFEERQEVVCKFLERKFLHDEDDEGVF